MSAHLLLPSPFHSEKCSCVQDFSRGSEKLLGYSKAIDWHEMNERPLLGRSGHHHLRSAREPIGSIV
jgi:hypothetical protein